MRVRSCYGIRPTVYADDDGIDADRVWKGSSANKDSKQQSAGATSNEPSLLILARHFFLPPPDADTMQAPTLPLNL